MTMRAFHALRSAAAALILILGIGSEHALAFHATKPIPRVTVSGKVVLGNAKRFHTVATVDRRAIFEATSAIRAMRADRVNRDAARYHFLIYEANRAFNRAVELAAEQAGVDLVVESGGVEAAGIAVVDLTKLTLESLAKVSTTKATKK